MRAETTQDDMLAQAVCELAVAMFDVTGAMLRLHDGDRLVVRGAAGPGRNLERIPAFMTRDLTAGQGLVIADVAHDRRWFLEPAVLATPGLRFYADMPLAMDGQVLGVLSLLGDAPVHDFDARRQSLLAQLAELAARLMALAAEARRDAGLNATLRAALKVQTARLDRIGQVTQVGYWTIDLATRALYWSDSLFALYGLDARTFAPSLSDHLDIYGERADDLLALLQHAVVTGEDFDFEGFVVRGTDGVRRRMQVRGGVERGEGPVRLCAVVRDISDAAASPPQDDALLRLTQELRHPLKDILETAHELEAGEARHPDLAVFSDSLRVSAQALDGLMPEAADHDSVVLADRLRAAAAPFAEQARLHGTRLDLHFADWGHSQARLDMTRLDQVLHQLLGHACRVTRRGTVSVTASQVQAEDAASGALETRLHIAIRDSGPGMSYEAAQKLLAGAPETGRDDLSLSIARAIVELMGGHMGIYAHPGEGMQVWFEVPVRWVQTSVPRPRHLPPDPMRPSAAADSHRGPAYAPRTAPARQMTAPVPHPAPVDAGRVNRDYLRALLQDMKLGLN